MIPLIVGLIVIGLITTFLGLGVLLGALIDWIEDEL